MWFQYLYLFIELVVFKLPSNVVVWVAAIDTKFLLVETTFYEIETPLML